SSSPGTDDAFVAELTEHGGGSVDRLGPVVVGIMDVDDVDMVCSQPFEGFVDGAPNAVSGVVPHPDPVSGDHEAFVIEIGRPRGRTDETPHLRRQQELLSRLRGQGFAEAAFAQSQTVVRGGVEIPYAQIPRLGDRSYRSLVIDISVEVPDRRTAESETLLVVQSADDSVLVGHSRLLNP